MTRGAGMSERIYTTPSPIPWGGVLLSAIASVSWAFLLMAGAAALGLHLLGVDAGASLGPVTAAVVVLAVSGRLLTVRLDDPGGAPGLAPLGLRRLAEPDD